MSVLITGSKSQSFMRAVYSRVSEAKKATSQRGTSRSPPEVSTRTMGWSWMWLVSAAPVMAPLNVDVMSRWFFSGIVNVLSSMKYGSPNGSGTNVKSLARTVMVMGR